MLSHGGNTGNPAGDAIYINHLQDTAETSVSVCVLDDLKFQVAGEERSPAAHATHGKRTEHHAFGSLASGQNNGSPSIL